MDREDLVREAKSRINSSSQVENLTSAWTLANGVPGMHLFQNCGEGNFSGGRAAQLLPPRSTSEARILNFFRKLNFKLTLNHHKYNVC